MHRDMGLYDDRLADLNERRPAARSKPSFGGATMGRSAEASRKSTSVQSLLFARPAWTESKAKAWARAQGYRYGKVDVTDQYIRIRQFDPKGSKVKRTIPFGRGIRAVVAREEKMARTAKEAPRRRRRSKKKGAPKRARRRRRVRASAAVAAPKRRRRRRAKKTVARRRRARRRTVRVMEAPRRRRRRRSSRVMAWRGNSGGHAKAARKGWRRRKKSGVRRRRRRVREAPVMASPRRRRRRSRRRARESVMEAPRRRRGHRRHRRMYASRSGGAMGIAELLVASATGGLGYILADGVDRFLATYNPGGTGARPTDKFTSDGAGTLANSLNVASRPTIVRGLAGVGMAALPAVGASFVRSPMAKAALEGAAIGAGVNLFKMVWNNLLIPLLTPKDTSTPSLQKSFIVRLYPAEVTAHMNMQQKAVSPGVLSDQQTGVGGDVGPFALSGDSPYLDAAQALRAQAGMSGPGSDYPTAAQALRAQAGMSDQFPSLQNTWGTGANPTPTGGPDSSWNPGPPPGVGPGPQAKPHADCGCIGENNPFLGFIGDQQEPDPLFGSGLQ